MLIEVAAEWCTSYPQKALEPGLAKFTPLPLICTESGCVLYAKQPQYDCVSRMQDFKWAKSGTSETRLKGTYGKKLFAFQRIGSPQWCCQHTE